ncbi:MAG: site-2 protease family protein [Proteobacteria bacterium]|nr:site-2 protease family protein [Pseudomonadota bacterium]
MTDEPSQPNTPEPDPHARTQENLNAVARQMLGAPSDEEKARKAAETPEWQKKLKKFGPIGAAAVFMFGKVKWVFAALKFAKFGSLLSMLLAVWVYAQFFGMPYAIGFVLLIFVHEMGHAIALRQQGIPAGVPVFIPFVGAFIQMKGMPRNAWVEAVVGIGGPLLGTVGAFACLAVAYTTESQLWFALANVGFLINLFNMIPISPLDGGRIVGVFGRWLWVVGYLIAGIVLVVTWSPILILILLMGLFNLKRILNPPEGYNVVAKERRAVMALAYFGGIGVMVLGMISTEPALADLAPPEVMVLYGGAALHALGGLWSKS